MGINDRLALRAAIHHARTILGRTVIALLLAGLLLIGETTGARAQTPCPAAPAVGSSIQRPVDLYSQNGTLNVAFNYYTSVSDAGLTLFCFVTPDGIQSPTLHVNPGDTLNIALTNMNPSPPPGAPTEIVSNASNVCGDMTMTITAVNMHFHGTNTSPTCHSDEVIHTIVNSGETFQYSLTFPPDEPPGLYWYHPHVHGLAEAAVQGGASGAIVVEGIANIQPAVTNLPEQILIIRDMNRTNTPGTDQQVGPIPAWDISLNYVPIIYAPAQTPVYTPSVITMQPGQQQFWRVVNASADTTVDLQVQYDGVPETLQVVGLDGVPTGSQDGTGQGTLVPMTDIPLSPAGRAEFIVTAPSSSVGVAQLLTLDGQTGPGGEIEPVRPLAAIQTTTGAPQPPAVRAAPKAPSSKRFAGLATATPTATRLLYFSEVDLEPDADDPDAAIVNFFITVDGATPTLFDPNLPPAIITTQGSVEDWTIENRTNEIHQFHMHQIHFLLEAVNGVPVPAAQQQYLDTIKVPYWSGDGPYPSITVRMDFRGMDTGDFVYHCHILAHEDAGMMATVRVLPAADTPTQVVSSILPQSRSVQVGNQATAFATMINSGAGTASACSIAPQTSLPASFSFQTTDPLSNTPVGIVNDPIDIGAGQSQSFILSLTPNAPIAPTETLFNFSCANAPAATSIDGVNELTLSASTNPVPDVVALAASGDPGYVDIPGATGTGVFAVATVNLGASGAITVGANTGATTLPVSLAICQTNPTTGACLAPPATTVTTAIAGNATPTFGVFVNGSAAIADSPGTNRVAVNFTDSGGTLRGKTSIAVRTQ